MGLSRESWVRGWGLGQTRSPLSLGQQTLSQGLPGEDFRTCGHGHMVCISAVLLCLRLKVDETTDRGHRAHRAHKGKGARPQWSGKDKRRWHPRVLSKEANVFIKKMRG